MRHDGRDYPLHVANLEVGKCRNCGEIVLDDLVADQIANELRRELHLLMPAQIRSGIEELQLTQKSFARSLGVAEATVSRWCTGTLIQSRAMDNLIRGYFATPEFRHALLQIEVDPAIGATVKFSPQNHNPASP
jgi:DNA-binding transcriptional regulator YiaG